MNLSAIIVGAGSSRRMGFDKLEADLAGETVLVRSLLAFEHCPIVSEIRLVTSREKLATVREQAKQAGVTKLVEVIEGGAERHLSVSAGLEKVDDGADLVAVHDAARPLVTPEAIARCAAVAAEHGAATLAHRVADTLKRANEDGEVCGSVSREDLWCMETPQIFRLGWLRRAYAAVLEAGELVTDEVSAIERIGERVHLVENEQPNLKITVPADIVVAEAVLSRRD